MALAPAGKALVETAYGVETVSEHRARLLALAGNVAQVIRARDGRIVRIVLRNEDTVDATPGRYGNPQKDIHRAESETNPPRVWEFKGLRRALVEQP